ncbi:hypothetical protein TNCV_4805901 [Trichonephila clavipes]|nr:hypothetical protein TNCV_4805901 [Trichonephila clavipes]
MVPHLNVTRTLEKYTRSAKINANPQFHWGKNAGLTNCPIQAALFKKTTDSDSKWCSNNENQEGCMRTCAKGSPNGLCEWRSGSMTIADDAGPTADYATCSPDLSACPDGLCDELELLEPTLCPQDCARKFSGEVIESKNGQGLYAAVGPCFCPALDDCICVRHYPSAEMRRHKTDHNRPQSTLKPIVEIMNNSMDQGKPLTETQEETSTSYAIVASLPALQMKLAQRHETPLRVEGDIEGVSRELDNRELKVEFIG